MLLEGACVCPCPTNGRSILRAVPSKIQNGSEWDHFAYLVIEMNVFLFVCFVSRFRLFCLGMLRSCRRGTTWLSPFCLNPSRAHVFLYLSASLLVCAKCAMYLTWCAFLGDYVSRVSCAKQYMSFVSGSGVCQNGCCNKMSYHAF